MLTRKTLKPLALACLLAVSAGATAQSPYDEGQKALREQDWMAAAEHFEDAFDSEQADAAMYWRAHALYKAGHRGDAHRQIRMLERRYPDSDWVREAQALQIEHGGSSQDAIVEDELRLFALHQLMEKDRERALPLVMKMLEETESEKVRRDALFILGRVNDPRKGQKCATLLLMD